MKNSILISALALGVMVISSCANEGIINEMSIGGNTVSFTAGTQSGLSKTVMTDDCKIIFAGGESIAIVSDNGTLFSASNSSSTSSAFAVFNAQVDKSVIDASSSFVAMYPDGVYNDGYQMELPAIQTATPNSFDPKANLLVANTTRDRMHFYFKNVCSYIEVDLPLETESVTVWSKSPLAGTIKVDAEGNITDTLNASNTVTLRGDLKPGKYCIAVLPGYKDSLVVNPTNGHLSNVSTEYYYMSRGGIYSADFEEKAFEPSPEHPEVQLLSPADIVDYVNASDEEIVTLNMALETYDHTDVILAISKCDKKVNLVIPEGVNDLEYVVDERSPLNEWGHNIPPSVPNLVSVSIPQNVTEIGQGAFRNSGITEVELPSGLVEIKAYAFSGCEQLVNINLPSSLTTIGGSAFNSCTSLTEINLPSSLTIIDGSAFYRCSKLVEVVIPDGVKEILPGTFAYCANLANVTIPNSVEFVAYNAFNGTSLPSLNLPSSVKNWGDYVFKDGNLVEIVIPESVEHLDEYLFYGFAKLKSVVIKGKVEVLETAVFSGCGSLEKVTLPDGLKEIKQYAFSNCENLKEIELPSSLTFIDMLTFNHSGLREITIPENVKTIGENAFFNCKNLTTVTISAEDIELVDWIFNGCEKLQAIYCTRDIKAKYSSMYPQMKVIGSQEEIADNSYSQIIFQKQYAAMNFTPENDYSIVIFEFEEQPYEVQVTITSDLFEKEESWGDAYYAAYFPAQYYLNDNTIRLNLNDVFYDNFAGLVNDRGETASKISTVAIQSTADGENVVYLKSVTFVKNDGSTVVLKNSEDGFDFVMEVIK